MCKVKCVCVGGGGGEEWYATTRRRWVFLSKFNVVMFENKYLNLQAYTRIILSLYRGKNKTSLLNIVLLQYA